MRRARGATTTETVMLLVLIAMLVIAGIKMLGGGIGQKVEFASDSVGAVSTESGEMERLRENQREAEVRRKRKGGQVAAGASQKDPTAHASKGAGQQGAGQANGPRASEGANAAASSPAATASSGGCGGGFNPFVVPIALGLLGLLGYVVVKSQKG